MIGRSSTRGGHPAAHVRPFFVLAAPSVVLAALHFPVPDAHLTLHVPQMPKPFLMRAAVLAALLGR